MVDKDWGKGRPTRPGNYIQLTEDAVSGDLFTRIVAAIHRLRSPSVPA